MVADHARSRRRSAPARSREALIDAALGAVRRATASTPPLPTRSPSGPACRPARSSATSRPRSRWSSTVTTGSCARSPPRTSSNRRRASDYDAVRADLRRPGGRVRRAAHAHRDVPRRGRLVARARRVASRSTSPTTRQRSPTRSRVAGADRARRRQRARSAVVALALYQRALRRWLDGPRSRELADLIDEEFAGCTSGLVGRSCGASSSTSSVRTRTSCSRTCPIRCPAPARRSSRSRPAGIGFVDTLCVHGTYQAAARAPVGAGVRARRHRRRGRRRRHAVRGRRPRAQRRRSPASFQTHTVLREDELVPIPGTADRRAGRGAGRVVRHHAVCVHAPHDAWPRTSGSSCSARAAASGSPPPISRRRSARSVIACASTPEKLALADARRRRRHRRLLRSRARPEGDDPRAHRWRCRPRRRPGRRPRSALMLRAPAVRGPLLVIGFASGDIPQVPLNQVLLNDRTVIGIDWGFWAGSRPEPNARAARRAVRDRVRDGRIRPAEPTAYRARRRRHCARRPRAPPGRGQGRARAAGAESGEARLQLLLEHLAVRVARERVDQLELLGALLHREAEAAAVVGERLRASAVGAGRRRPRTRTPARRCAGSGAATTATSATAGCW